MIFAPISHIGAIMGLDELCFNHYKHATR